jgi:tRNA (cytidine/uridine-2'-O-)-methyltransferase
MFHVVLIEPEIPPNTGNIGRLCLGAGACLHLVRPLGFSLDDRALRRAGLDYWPHLRLTVHDSWEAYLASTRPARLFFASTRGSRSLYDCVFRSGDHLAFGNESSGLPEPFYARYADSLIQIPMPGPHARSLNLANAAAIVTYEAFRQIGHPPAG